MPADRQYPEIDDAFFRRDEELRDKVVLPLARRRGDVAACLEIAERLLAEEADPECRGAMISAVSHALHCGGEVDLSWAWCLRSVEEQPDHPLTLNGPAAWLYYTPLGEPTADDLRRALDYNLVALEKAREAECWQRSILHDRCRIATSAGRWDVVEAAMREILEVWRNPSNSDIPMFEWDWLDRAPDGVLDGGLLADYRGVMERVLEFRRRRDEREAPGEPEP